MERQSRVKTAIDAFQFYETAEDKNTEERHKLAFAYQCDQLACEGQDYKAHLLWYHEGHDGEGYVPGTFVFFAGEKRPRARMGRGTISGRCAEWRRELHDFSRPLELSSSRAFRLFSPLVRLPFSFQAHCGVQTLLVLSVTHDGACVTESMSVLTGPTTYGILYSELTNCPRTAAVLGEFQWQQMAAMRRMITVTGLVFPN